MFPSSTTLNERDDKLHDWNIIEKPKNPQCDTSVIRYQNSNKRIGVNPITWTVSDISKAGYLLTVPPKSPNFDDEQEMRRVYTLIYDVFRCKLIIYEYIRVACFHISNIFQTKLY